MPEIPILKKMINFEIPVGTSRKTNGMIAREVDKIKDALRRIHNGDKEFNKGRTTTVSTLADLR